MLLQVVQFQSPRLESAFQDHQLAHESRLHRRLQACAAIWSVFRLQQLLWSSSPLKTSKVTLAALAALLSISIIGCCNLARKGHSWTSAAVFCASWLIPLVERRSDWEGCASLPGRAVALLALVLTPASDMEGCLLHGGVFAALVIGADLWLCEDRERAWFSAAASAIAALGLGTWSCQLQQGLERMHRELFLLQYRAAAKAQHFRLLLGCLLPAEIIEPYFERCIRFEGGDLLASPVAQRVPCAGVLFMAIHAFDEMTVSVPAIDLMQFLNQLFSELDRQCEERRLVKIETVGEVYVAASGLFGSCGGPNIPSLAEFALWSRKTAGDLLGVELRMGLHCGPLVAGIVGDKLPRFRLFGDTVNTTARLEQHSPPSCLLVSESAAEVVGRDSLLQVSEYGVLPMKGLGNIRTFHVDYSGPMSQDSTARLSPPMLARMLGRDRGDSLGSEVTTTPVVKSSISNGTDNSNLHGFLAALPELDAGSAADIVLPGELSTVQAPHSQHHKGTTPMMSPLWGHLERGLMDPACIEAEHLPGEPLQSKTVATPQIVSSPFFIRSPPSSWSPVLSFCSPTGWLSPGQQLPPRSSSVFIIRRSEAGALPSVLEGDTYADDPPQDQLDELHRRAGEACRWWKLPFLGPLCFQDSGEEARFRETFWLSSRTAVRCTCTYGGVAVLVVAFANTTWKFTVVAGFIAMVLWVCCYAVNGGGGYRSWWALAHVIPALVASVLLLPPPHPPLARCEVLLWFCLASTVNAELPYSAILVSAALPRCIIGHMFLNLPAAVQTVATASALVLVGLARESLARRCFASEGLCSDVLNRLRTVAEDLMPPSVVAEIRSRRFGLRGAEPGQASGLVVHRFDVVSVIQTDLVGFTALARTMQPEEVLRMLNELFSAFDRIVGVHDLFKMETVGDAYICASGLPDYSRGEHRPQALLQLALDLHVAVARYCKRAGLSLGLRAGLHTGRAIGGVVGTTMQRYHLFGGTMHIVEKLEATSPTGAVHLSGAACCALEATGQMPPCYGFQRLVLEPMEEGELVTSKGERILQRAVGGKRTFAVRAPCAEEVGLSGEVKPLEAQVKKGLRHRTLVEKPA